MRSARVLKERLKISVYLNGTSAHEEEVERVSKILEPGFTKVWGYIEVGSTRSSHLVSMI